LRNAVHIGHSTGGGEARATSPPWKRPRGRAGPDQPVPPLVVKTPANPGGLPLEVFDGLRQQLAAGRAQFYLDFASGPFTAFNRVGAKVSQGVIQNLVATGDDGSARRTMTASRRSRNRLHGRS